MEKSISLRFIKAFLFSCCIWSLPVATVAYDIFSNDLALAPFILAPLQFRKWVGLQNDPQVIQRSIVEITELGQRQIKELNELEKNPLCQGLIEFQRDRINHTVERKAFLSHRLVLLNQQSIQNFFNSLSSVNSACQLSARVNRQHNI